MFGADDFLPCLTWVLLRSDVVTLQVDTDYMMELLDPTQLQGEGETNAMKRAVIRGVPSKAPHDSVRLRFQGATIQLLGLL